MTMVGSISTNPLSCLKTSTASRSGERAAGYAVPSFERVEPVGMIEFKLRHRQLERDSGNTENRKRQFCLP